MTLCFQGLTASSFAGTFYLDYFFAFHLLNIVATNQLLKNVVKAVTQNGTDCCALVEFSKYDDLDLVSCVFENTIPIYFSGASLLWVAIMGVIIIYIYALIAFAFFRPLFNPEAELYCNTLGQCTVTLLRYGGAGKLTDVRINTCCTYLL